MAFLVPVVYERLCTLVRLRDANVPIVAMRFVLPRDLLAEIEARQRETAAPK